MGILDTLAARLGYTKASAARAPGEMLSVADGYRWDMPPLTEPERQMRLYAALSWISTAIDRTAEIAAAGEFRVTRIAGEPGGADDEQIPNHPFEQLLRRPNPGQSGDEFLRDLFTMYRTTGNLYLYKNAASETAPPDELWIVPSHMIRPIPDGRSYVAGYEFAPPNGRMETIPAWKIVHMKTSNPLNPFVGLSALQSLYLDAMGDIAAQKWNAEFFSKNNAKLPSILAFKQMIADPEWNKIKAERDKEWSGTNRSGVTLLRGVGDALQLIQASATQKDMEFLAARNFTKEEIYGKLAPGLASILAVNATEANAIAGKSTLIEFGVWPFMAQLASKMTADLLPLYGEGLRGEFDDIRISNRILDLQEQAEFSKYHIVNEIRAEYYNEGPLELDPELLKDIDEAERPASKLDPRGFLFPAQIGPSTPAPGKKPAAPPPPPAFPNGTEQEPPDDEEQPDGEMMLNDMDKQAEQMAEMKAWERFALKRLGKAGGREFVPRLIPLFTAGAIKAKLAKAATPADVRAAFAPHDAGALAEAVAELRRFNDLAGSR